MKTVNLLQHKSGNHFVATVVSVKYGVAKTVRHLGVITKVSRQADHIPYLTAGDEVLCCLVSQGIYVLARSLAAQAKPLLKLTNDKLKLGFDEGALTLASDGEIGLRNAEANLMLSPSGEIHSYAKIIKQATSKASISLSDQGRIDFNVPD